MKSHPPIGLPDPNKYPNWKPGKPGPKSPQKKSETPQTRPDEFILGGLDSPCFINGKVMTRREALALMGEKIS